MNSLCTVVPEPEAIQLLQKYNIHYPRHGFARTVDEAAEIAGQIGYPVVLKVVSPQVIHKSDAGGVCVNLNDAHAVRAAYRQIVDSVTQYNHAAVIDGVLVCEQAKAGLELVVGATEDEVFGKTIMFGLGGIFIEILKDVSLRICPLREDEALRMIREIKGYPLLQGIRGGRALDEKALSALLLNISRLLTECSWIKELDLNPVRLYEEGVVVLDARIISKT